MYTVYKIRFRQPGTSSECGEMVIRVGPITGSGSLASLSGWNRGSCAVSAVVALLFVAAQAHAGEIEPRSYVNTPVGINFLLAGYAYTDGGLSTAGSSPIKDAQLKINTGALAYARTLDVWGNSGKFDVILPYSQLSGNAMVAGQPRERDVSGFHDPLFRFSVNFYGAPRCRCRNSPTTGRM